MSTRHKHADVIVAFANGQDVEFWDETDNKWIHCLAGQGLLISQHLKYRIKPRTIMIGDMEVPEPLKSSPSWGDIVFRPCVVKEMRYKAYAYDPWNWDHIRYLEVGFLHDTKEAAITHAKALIKISGGTV